MTKPLARKTGIVLNVALEPDEGITGRVLTPDGKAAAGATVAVGTWTNEVTVRDGTLQYGHHAERLRGFAKTVADGSFRTPAEVDDWVLVVAHESGYAEATAAELANQSTVTLKAWGRLEGKFILDGRPMAGQPLNIGAGRGDVSVALHYSGGEIETDAAGKFVVARLPPVKLYVTLLFKRGESSYNLLWFSGLVDIQPGQTTRIALPRAGQAVTGRLALPVDSVLTFDDLEIDLSMALRPPSISEFRTQVDQHYAAYSALMQSERGKSFRREGIAVNRGGRFYIEGIPETYYVLRQWPIKDPPHQTPIGGKQSQVIRRESESPR